MKTTNYGVMLAGASLLATSGLLADDVDDYIIAIQSDNDLYWGKGDEEYTNGQRANVSFPPGKEPDWLVPIVDWFPVVSEHKNRRYSITYGQSVFTPADIRRETVAENERAFAAYMYLGAGYADGGDYSTNLVNVNFGVVGDLARGRQAQKIIHSIKGSSAPIGWKNQLGNEAAVMVQYVHLWSGSQGSMFGGKYWDVTPHAGFSIGSPNTHVMAGTTFRIGTGIDREVGGLPLVQPQMAVHDIYQSDDRFAINFVAGFERRYVFYDLTLDTGIFQNGHSVNKFRKVGHFHVGFAAYWRKWRWGYSHVFEAKKYSTQPRKHHYGSFTISRYF